MSLFALPVTVSDLTTLQSGIQFFTNTAEATAEVGSINAPGTTTDSVFIYASKLIQNNISLSQVAMAVSALMEGGTIAVGNTTTPNTLTLLSTQFLPGQVAVALANGFNPTVFAAESLGSALSTQASFQPFVALSVSQFAQSVSTLTGVNVNAIQQFVTNWQNFFTGVGASALQGRTVAQASYGAAFGDAVGVALLNPTTANLQTVVSTTPGVNPFTPNTIAGLVANALIDVAEGKYVTGVTLGALPLHQALQGEAGVSQGGVFLTQGLDTPTSGFSLSPLGTPLLNGFTATQAGAIFQAPATVTALGIAVNTLNSGDNLQDTVGDGTLNLQMVGLTIGANPPFASNVTMNGIKIANITNQAAFTPGGFQGNITGLLVENNNASVAPVTIGGTGQGLKTLLTDINITGYGGAAGDDINTVVLATALGDATKTINASFTGGNLGTTAAGGAQEFAISNDTGGGTAASPNLTYGTWSLTVNNNANLQLEQSVTTDGTGAVTAEGGVGGATALVLKGAGNLAIGQAAAGDWQLLKSIDASATTGALFVTGATSGVGSQARATAANPGWLFGSDFGFLDDTGGTFNLTSFKLGSGTTFLDVSSASTAQIAALTTTAGGAVSLTNEIIVKDTAIATPLLTAATFANIAGFTALGIGGPTAADGAGGVLNMAFLKQFNTIDYITNASGALTINNQQAELTVRTFDNANGNTIAVGTIGPLGGFNDAFNLVIGNPFQGTADQVGTLAASVAPGLKVVGDEVIRITSTGGPAVGPVAPANLLGYTSLTPTVGGLVAVLIDGNRDLTIGTNPANANHAGAIAAVDAGGALLAGVLSITITNTGLTTLHGSNNSGVAPATSHPLDFFILGDSADGQGPGSISPFTSSTNARLIDASKSGGLIMEAGDANYTVALTVAGSQGDVIIGAAAAGNVLGGSIGNDTFTSNAVGFADSIYTGGGKDVISLAAGHAVTDHVGLYEGFDTPGILPGGIEIPRFQSIVGTGDVPQLGWWGQATGIVATGYNATGLTYAGLAANTGTNADETTVANFKAGLDIVDFAASAGGLGGAAWAAGGLNGVGAGTSLGLVTGNLSQVPAGPAVIQQVDAFATTFAAATNLVELTGQTFLSPTAVVSYLHDPTHLFNLTTGLAANQSAHMLVAYQDAATNTHIADLAMIANGGATVFLAAMTLHLSDIVQLTGVQVTDLTATSVHFV